MRFGSPLADLRKPVVVDNELFGSRVQWQSWMDAQNGLARGPVQSGIQM